MPGRLLVTRIADQAVDGRAGPCPKGIKSVDQIRNDVMIRISDERKVDFEVAMHELIAHTFGLPTRDVRILPGSGLGPPALLSLQRFLPT